MSLKSLTLVVGILLLGFTSCDNCVSPVANEVTIQEAIDYSLDKLSRSLLEVPINNYPIRTKGIGEWEVTSPSEWTSGFFPGCLWYAYLLSEDTTWISDAKIFTEGLEEQKFNTGTHDLGFMILNSFGNGYKILNNIAYKEVVLQAASSLATRFNPVVGCIQSWNGEFQVIIDNMMNLELLYWASKNGGGGNLYDMAVSHANKTIENHVREDGSSFHVVVYDEQTGEVIEKRTAQGYSANSTWARGQAWGLYGFTMCYRETQDVNFLNTAIKMADYFIDHLPGDFVPYWDFNLPADHNKKYRDASAAAIACSGLLELSDHVVDGFKYSEAANKIINSLAINYLSIGTNSSGILLHCAYNVNSANPYDWDASTIWGDYYFFEAILRSNLPVLH
jgi:unsaturated chondroitin disaccharide hydrolase